MPSRYLPRIRFWEDSAAILGASTQKGVVHERDRGSKNDWEMGGCF